MNKELGEDEICDRCKLIVKNLFSRHAFEEDAVYELFKGFDEVDKEAVSRGLVGIEDEPDIQSLEAVDQECPDNVVKVNHD